MKTIAELEADATAAIAAYDKASARREALTDLIRALDVIDALRSHPALLPSDVAHIVSMPIADAWNAAVLARKPLRAEVDRLETECHRMAHALNDAPEEAA